MVESRDDFHTLRTTSCTATAQTKIVMTFYVKYVVLLDPALHSEVNGTIVNGLHVCFCSHEQATQKQPKSQRETQGIVPYCLHDSYPVSHQYVGWELRVNIPGMIRLFRYL